MHGAIDAPGLKHAERASSTAYSRSSYPLSLLWHQNIVHIGLTFRMARIFTRNPHAHVRMPQFCMRSAFLSTRHCPLSTMLSIFCAHQAVAKSAAAVGAAPLLRDLFRAEETLHPLPWGLTFAEKQQAVSHDGNHARLNCVLRRLETGDNVSIAVVGGSVSAGTSMRVRPDQSGLFHHKLLRWLQQRFPAAKIHLTNAAMPAVPPYYMEHCIQLHVPKHVDLVLLEAAANMCSKHDCPRGMMAVERILRSLLLFPRAPAVMLVHTYPFWTMETPKGWRDSKKKRRQRKQAAKAAKAAGRGRGRQSRWQRLATEHGFADPASIVLDEKDLAFEFHRQWGHGTNEHMVDELAKYYVSQLANSNPTRTLA